VPNAIRSAPAKYAAEASCSAMRAANGDRDQAVSATWRTD
jgi:hypothetical protein